MHILIDLQACQSSGSRNRGIGRYSMAVTQALIDLGAERHRIGILVSDRFPDTLPSLRAKFVSLLGEDNFHIFSVPAGCSHLADPEQRFRLRAAEAIRREFIQRIQPDIVWISSLFEGLVEDVSISTDLCGIPSVVTLYDLIPWLNRDVYLADTNTRQWYLRRLEQLRQADCLLAISESSRNEGLEVLLPENSQRIVNISAAIDAHFAPMPVTKHQRTELLEQHGIQREIILYTGGIDYRKNIDRLIQAFAQLDANHRSSHQLVIVCSVHDTERQRLQSLANSLGLKKQDLVLTGYVSDQDLCLFYNLAKLFVFPSLHEGFGLPVLEAMACGCPVIGANTSSIPEVLGREDALFNPYSVEAIATAIQSALENETFRKDIAKHGLLQAKTFSWHASAQRALEAIETLTLAPGAIDASPAVKHGKPTLAYLSPLPPQPSGISDYSVELLPALAQHYDIEVIATEPVSDERINALFPIRDTHWFEHHAQDYDRILYHIGNSHFHLHMLSLMQRHPGAVLLHDYYLSGTLNVAQAHGIHPGLLNESVFQSHGYRGLLALHRQSFDDFERTHAANQAVFQNAHGVLVHSQHSMELAERDYGKDSVRRRIQQVPFARSIHAASSRRQVARDRLQLANAKKLVCAFGFMAPTKLNLELIDAWKTSGLDRDPTAQLVFVGQGSSSNYGNLVDAAAEGIANIKITGFVTADEYQDWLAAADLGVQLRTRSRGETSAAIYDCLAAGVALIYNAHGSAAELPENIGHRLPDHFATADLVKALRTLLDHSTQRQALARSGRQYVQAHHTPTAVARAYAQAIETLYAQSPIASQERLVERLSRLARSRALDAPHLPAFAEAISQNHQDHRPPRLLLNLGNTPISALPWLTELAERLPRPWHFEVLVQQPDNTYSSSRTAVCAALGLPCQLVDTPIHVGPTDAWLHLKDTVTTRHIPPPLPALYSRCQAVLTLRPEANTASTLNAIFHWLSTNEVRDPLQPYNSKVAP